MLEARKSLRYLLLITILGAGLYLRLANLSQVQLFGADQGYYSLEMVEWLKGGHWPLIGAMRRYGDHAIGPGFYYVLAPLMWITNVHPASGAATIAIFKVLAIFLAYVWLKRSTANEPAAIALAFVLAVSHGWIMADRYLHWVELLPFLTVAVVFLLDRIEEAPVSSIALLCIVWAYIPHIHTTGLLLIPPSMLAAIYSFRQVRKKVHETSMRYRIVWFAIVVVTLCLLYIPPVLYELKPGPGNVEAYIRNMMSPEVRFADTGKVNWTAFFNFPIERFLGSMVWYRISFPLMRVLYFASILYASVWWLFREKRPSLFFMLLLLVEFLLVPVVYGHPAGFFLVALVPLPPLLISFAVASLPQLGQKKTKYLRILSLLGVLLIVGTGILSLRISIRVPDGHTSYGYSFARMQRVASQILAEAKGRNFSFLVAPNSYNPYGYNADYQYLLWYGGNRPQNHQYSSTRISHGELGEMLFVLCRPGWHMRMNCNDWVGVYAKTVVEDVLFYRIRRSSIPPHVKGVQLTLDEGCVNLGPVP